MVHFSYVVQSVDDEIDSVQKKGEITAKSFRRIFRDRDWSLESSLVYALGKASPGLAVANHNDGSTLWMSTYINDGIVWYVVGVSNSAQLPPVYSFKQRKLLSDCHFETADR